jgi:multidrug efflux pump subunit AcrB
MKLGISGYLAQSFISSTLTPLILLASLAMGLLALINIPREEEPQISVPMVDIFVQADGLLAPDAVELVTEPLEAIVKGIDEVEHIYSQTLDDRIVVTARFFVGTDGDNAILRVHDEIRANFDRIPYGIPEPLIVGRGINDVAIVVATLSPDPELPERWTSNALFNVADELRAQLVALEDVGITYLVGGDRDQIRIEPDPERLSMHGITLQQLAGKVRDANRSFVAGQVVDGDRTLSVLAGQTLEGMPDIGLLVIASREGRPVYVRDVADVVVGGSPSKARVWHMQARQGASDKDPGWASVPAISIAIGKREGANAVLVAERISQKLEQLQGTLIPEGLQVSITRNYGETANDKANELLYHLALATISIVLLVSFVVGRREGAVVFVVIPTTILLTLFASNLMGYTINRVSLFAIIFSIGILVDDAIVMIENISRHWAMKDGRTRIEAAVEAVAEVGNPTILATLTVVAALLPMLFVSGLMGPYMAPIPVNASAAMVFSFFVAVMIAPWLMVRFAGNSEVVHHKDIEGGGVLGRIYRAMAEPVIRSSKTAKLFLLAVSVATFLSMLLVAFGAVSVKLLPFDNKSELQVVVDLPEGASLERTERVLSQAADLLLPVPEIISIQSYAGTAAPFNFNGLVRHYFLRRSPELGDLQVNLSSKDDRDRTSHEIALDIRERLSALESPEGTSVSVVEVPPGPPVLATLLAEIYGPDAQTRRDVARQVKAIFEDVPFIVDVDDSIGLSAPRLHLEIDQDSLEFFGVEQSDVYDTLALLFNGMPVGYSHRGGGRNPIEIVVQLPNSDLTWTERLASTPVPANALPGDRRIAELGDVLKAEMVPGSLKIYRHNGRFADMVLGELAGQYEAPIYGMLEVQSRIDALEWQDNMKPEVHFHGQPDDESTAGLLWDGEWEVTYVTFRDMGAAFGVAILGIYFLVVMQFGSFRLPIVILVPVPLTLIGIMIGHWLFSAAFTATSMIGFIALAGIIVRNSILLVDFIRSREQSGAALEDILLEAGSIRFKPILLTAVAAMIGAAVILFDPIFQGLAISLLFGLISSTLLTVLVIPALYRVFKG